MLDLDNNSLHLDKRRRKYSVSVHRRESAMKDVRLDGLNGTQKILVNPLVAGSNIHYDKGKYTLANSTFGVTESTASFLRNDTVHYNPKFLNQNYAFKKDNIHYNPNYLSGSAYVSTTSHAIHVNPNFIPVSRSVQPYSSAYQNRSHSSSSFENASKYKYVRKEEAGFVAPPAATTVQKCEPKTASKYKLVYSTAPSAQPVLTSPAKSGFVIRSKYTLRTCQPNLATSTPTSSAAMNRETKKRIRYDFKRISRTKLVRKSVMRPRGSLKKRFKNSRHFNSSSFRKTLFKLNCSRASSECSIFKKFSRTKIVRKSVLRAHIDSRKLLRKSLNSSVTNLLEFKPLVNSKYKLVLKRGVSKKPVDSNVSVKQSPNKSNFNKSKRRRSAIAKITSKLRKINQHCMFYNRFGRCKGKDRGTCNKKHDPLYVSICKKLPFGECTDKSCLLSHDVRPGKMATCYHYLAGICKRDSCPFLHIKVNPKAPICHSFLLGYCPDVYNCMKRHEYVCPVFAEKGTCPKGKSCAHPHKIPTVHSKLLGDHQRPLMARNRDPAPPPPPPVTCSESCIFLVSEDPEPVLPNLSDNPKKPSEEPPPFTRYFSMPIPSAPVTSPFQPPSSPCSEPSDPESLDDSTGTSAEPVLPDLTNNPSSSQELSTRSFSVPTPSDVNDS